LADPNNAKENQMPHTLKGWLMFVVAVGVALWLFNNVAFLNGLVGRRA
jgi:hypothetical protein